MRFPPGIGLWSGHMGARLNVALLVSGLVIGCGKNSSHDGAVTDDGGGGAGNPGIGGSSGAGGSTGGAMTVGDGAASDVACVPTEQMVMGSHPDILVVLDASGSMDNDIEEANCDYGCGLKSKWALTTAAVKQVVSATGASVSWGLKFFANQDQMCTVSPGVSVPVGLGKRNGNLDRDRRPHLGQRRRRQRRGHADARGRNRGGGLSLDRRRFESEIHPARD